MIAKIMLAGAIIWFSISAISQVLGGSPVWLDVIALFLGSIAARDVEKD